MRPRLLFDENDLPELRQRARGVRGRKLLDHAVRYCERYQDPADALYFDFRERRNMYWRTRRGNFMVPSHMGALALVGWLAERRDFLETARDALLVVIEERLADQELPPDPPQKQSYPGWRRNHGHDAGKYFFQLGFLYDTLQHLMTAEQRRTVLAHAQESMEIGRESVPRALQGLANNRGGRFMVGLCVLAAAVRDEPGIDGDPAADLADWGPVVLDEAVRWAFGRDGGTFEGNSYGPSALTFYLLGAQAFARFCGRDLRRDVRFARVADYLTHELVMPRGFFNNFNDCHKGQTAHVLIYAGCRRDRPAALWTWDQALGDDGSPYSVTAESFHATDFPAIPWSLLWVADEPKAQRPEACGYARARHFRERGMVSMRTGWSAEDMHVSMFSGRQSRTCHRQSDQNQVTVYALGEHFLIDPGYTVTDPATGETVRAGGPEAHNAVWIDGKGQHGPHDGVGWPEGRIAAFENGDDFAYVLADARECYGPHGTIARAERHLYFSRRGDADPYLIWIDDLEVDETGEEHEFALSLLTAPGNAFAEEGGRVCVRAPGAVMDVHVALPDDPALDYGFYGEYPRLRMATRAARGRFVMLLHPRRLTGAQAHLEATASGDAIEVAVSLGDAVHRYRFDTCSRAEICAGDERICVARLAC